VNANGFHEVMGHGKCSRNTSRMDAALQVEGEEDDTPNSRHCRPNQRTKTRTASVDDGNFFSFLHIEEPSDADDNDFDGKSSSESGTETNSTHSPSDSEIEEITNEEVSVIPS
jgi:hypothetical protein